MQTTSSMSAATVRAPLAPRVAAQRARSVRVGAMAPAAPTPSGQEAASAAKAAVVADEAAYVLNTYGRPADPAPLVITHGKGTKMWDMDGKEYLDFSAGIAVNCLGHSDPTWVEAVTEQAGKLAHTSNLFHTVPQVELAKRLVTNTFGDKVFFCNSGTEANEAAIKFARKWARVNVGVDPYDAEASAPSGLVSMSSAFHGRTMGALTLTYKDNYKIPFGPILSGHQFATFNDLESVRAVVKKGETAAVFIEPVQGEGGIHPSTAEFLKGVREICDEAEALLVFDEVQCGLGRTGKLFAYEHFGVEPDIMTIAKPLAAGLPIGAVVMKQSVADAMAPGDHGSTFAGNPFVCAAANSVFDTVNDAKFLAAVEAKGEKLKDALRASCGSNPHVQEVRGSGLLVGVQLNCPAGPVVAAAREAGVVVITAGAGDVIRMVPPLNVLDSEIETCAAVVGECLAALDA